MASGTQTLGTYEPRHVRAERAGWFDVSPAPWRSPRERSRPEIQVWAFPLDGLDDDGDALIRSLSPSERQRANRFRSATDRRRFAASRANVRTLLAACAGVAPGAVEFRYGPWGKPALSAPAGTGLCFNASHSGGWGLCVVTRRCEVGIDLERVRPLACFDAMTKQLLTARERATLAATPEPDRLELFFRYWTLREAWLKGLGTGLGGPLAEAEIVWDEDEDAPVSSGRSATCQGRSWTLTSWTPIPGFVAALAVREIPRASS